MDHTDMYAEAVTRVRSACSGKFTINVGVHQGSGLCPFLFPLESDQLTGSIEEEMLFCMTFADDVLNDQNKVGL